MDFIYLDAERRFSLKNDAYVKNNLDRLFHFEVKLIIFECSFTIAI
jgi:hypothetical protein